MRVIERKKEHYEVQEVPYGKVYSWRPEHVSFECDCGETLEWTGGSAQCRCGTSYEEFGCQRVEKEDEEAYQPWIKEYEAWREAKAASGLQHEYYGFVREENGE